MQKLTLSNVTENLEELAYTREKCIRCSMCKFPPLATVENAAHSMGCPSYEEFLFHANSGGGLVAMANSLAWGRSEVNETVWKTVHGCTLCGLCDVSCKYGASIEVFDTLLALRKKVYDAGHVNERHRAVIQRIHHDNHPLLDHVSERHQVIGLPSDDGADTLLWVGSRFGRDRRLKDWLYQAIFLLRSAGVSFKLLYEDEPDSGRAALEIGNVALFKQQSRMVSEALQYSGVKQVICLAAEDYSTLRSQTPKYAPIEVQVSHISELYQQLLKTGKLKVTASDNYPAAAWHDPCYLGRLGGQFQHWQGQEIKVNQMPVFEPAKPIDYGSGGVFEAPRQLLDQLLAQPRLEFSRRKEYSFNAGETGQAAVVMPEFARATAKRRLQEARDLGIRNIVTECPQAYLQLLNAADDFDELKVISLTELISQALNTGGQAA